MPCTNLHWQIALRIDTRGFALPFAFILFIHYISLLLSINLHFSIVFFFFFFFLYTISISKSSHSRSLILKWINRVWVRSYPKPSSISLHLQPQDTGLDAYIKATLIGTPLPGQSKSNDETKWERDKERIEQRRTIVISLHLNIHVGLFYLFLFFKLFLLSFTPILISCFSFFSTVVCSIDKEIQI